jgi:hypothetical protein
MRCCQAGGEVRPSAWALEGDLEGLAQKASGLVETRLVQAPVELVAQVVVDRST